MHPVSPAVLCYILSAEVENQTIVWLCQAPLPRLDPQIQLGMKGGFLIKTPLR